MERKITKAVARIEEMERCFDLLQEAVKKDPTVVERSALFHALMMHLLRYYDGGQWLQDYALDEEGLLPPTLKRGVLSEDGVYNFLASIKR